MNTCKLTGLYILFLLLLTVSNAIADELKEGKWEGTFTDHIGNSYNYEYNIIYIKTDGQKTLQIEAVNLDLEPKPDFTYQLEDINVKDQTIIFKIPDEYDTKQCTLVKQQEHNYSGKCQSDKAPPGELSTITMNMPPEE